MPATLLPLPDLILLAFLTVFCLRGLFRGTLRELSNLLAWGLALFASLRFSGLAAAGLGPWLGKDSPWLGPATQATAFLVVWIGVNLVGRFLCFIVRSGSLGPADRMGGGVLGAAKAVLLAAAALALVEAYAPDRLPGRDRETRLLPYVLDLSGYLRRAAPGPGMELPKGAASVPILEPQPPKR
ncbi:MAG: CvpA family protein [Candidatus Tectomicrobia bacterium]|nr:CvpA family protein [Candidatus Tectomicrobia bacterium]